MLHCAIEFQRLPNISNISLFRLADISSAADAPVPSRTGEACGVLAQSLRSWANVAFNLFRFKKHGASVICPTWMSETMRKKKQRRKGLGAHFAAGLGLVVAQRLSCVWPLLPRLRWQAAHGKQQALLALPANHGARVAMRTSMHSTTAAAFCFRFSGAFLALRNPSCVHAEHFCALPRQQNHTQRIIGHQEQ